MDAAVSPPELFCEWAIEEEHQIDAKGNLVRMCKMWGSFIYKARAVTHTPPHPTFTLTLTLAPTLAVTRIRALTRALLGSPCALAPALAPDSPPPRLRSQSCSQVRSDSQLDYLASVPPEAIYKAASANAKLEGLQILRLTGPTNAAAVWIPGCMMYL